MPLSKSLYLRKKSSFSDDVPIINFFLGLRHLPLHGQGTSLFGYTWNLHQLQLEGVMQTNNQVDTV